MIIGTNRVLVPLPVSAGDVLLDNSHGQYNDGLVMVKRLLEIYEQGQLEVTPRSIFDAQEMVTVGKEVWMDGYDLEDFEIHAAGVINELIEQVLCRMAPRGLTIDWNHDQQCLIVEEID
jgi:hypothetical protein